MIPDSTEVFLNLAAGLLNTQTLRHQLKGKVIAITADKDQYPRLIGKQGRHILSLERIAKAFGYTLKAEEPYTASEPLPARVRGPRQLKDLLSYTLSHIGLEDFELTDTTQRGLQAFTVISAPIADELRDAIEAIMHSIARTDSQKISIAWLN